MTDATLPRPPRRFAQHLPVVLSLLAGLTVSAVLFVHARRLEQRRIQLEFDGLASALNTQLQRRVAANIEVLQSIGSFYAASQEVAADEFREFTRPSMEVYPGIRWLAWAPRVGASRVSAYLEEAAKLGVPAGYAIRGPDGQPMPSPPTPTTTATAPGHVTTAPSTGPADNAGPPDLFPIQFISPHEGQESLAGVDLDSFWVCRAAMARAVAEDRVVATGPITLIGDPVPPAPPPPPGPAVAATAVAAAPFDALVFLPIYDQRAPTATADERRRHLRGFAIAALRFRDLMASAMTAVDARGQEIRLYDHGAAGDEEADADVNGDGVESVERDGDSGAGGGGGGGATSGRTARLLYRSVPEQADPRRQGRDDLETRPWASTLTVAGRELKLTGLPTLEHRDTERRGGPWAVLGGGVLCTLLLSAYLRAVSGRQANVETLVAKRTGQLTKANADLGKQIQERHEAEKALREAEAVYHSLVETLPQNIFRKDLDGRFTFGNRNFCTELGTTTADVVGKTDHDFFPAALADRYRDDDRRVIETGQTMDIVEEHVKPDGSKLYVQVMKTPVIGPGGSVAGTQGIFWDVTDRKLAEQELEKKNRQLEEAARSERLAHQALQYAHDELKRAQSHLVQSEKLVGLGQMVAGVAHEINNPLAFVSNNVAVLQRDLKAIVELLKIYQEADPVLAERSPDVLARAHDLAERVDLEYTLSNLDELIVRSRDGLKRIQQIVKDLRNFARLDEADLHEVDLNQGIDSTVNIVLGHAKKKQVKIEKELGNIPPVPCYPAKVNQVVMNLITNAIDASREGGKVRVRSFLDRANGDPRVTGAADGEPVVKIQVTDEGTGIDPAIRQRIFDPFFTTKPPGQGTGLGLSISYGIIQDHGGTIDVDSAPGAGSTFTVVLPVRGAKG